MNARWTTWVFRLAGAYGLLVLGGQFGLGPGAPTGSYRPEQYFGFLGVALAWQLAFLVIARDPARFRPVMPAAVAEKLFFGVPAVAMAFASGHQWGLLVAGGIDVALGLLFATCYWGLEPAAGDP